MSYSTLEARDVISKGGPVKEEDLNTIVDRLYTTSTISKSGNSGRSSAGGRAEKRTASPDEIQTIVNRLASTHTKSTKGGESCRPIEPPKTPGYGLKMLPVIEGIEEKFKGSNAKPETEISASTARLHSSHTKAWSSRLGFPRILLYPERTILHNDVEKIVAYQQSGAVAKQPMLARREKWFN